jgi:plastocyanin
MSFRRIVPSLALALILSVPAWPAPAGAAPRRAPVRIGMVHFEYAPARVQIPVGGGVAWHYDEEALDPQPNCESPYFQIPGSPVSCPGHSATSVATRRGGAPLFDTGLHRAEGFPKSIGFFVPGVFRYFCTVHGGDNPNNPITAMNGVVVVVPPSGNRVSDRDDVRGLLDLRALTAARSDGGELSVTVTTWESWATASLAERSRNRLQVAFDVNTDGAIDLEDDVVARLVFAGGRLVARLSGVDGGGTLPAFRVSGNSGVRFTLPASSRAADAGSDHQLAATSRTGSSDRVPAAPGWLPVQASA